MINHLIFIFPDKPWASFPGSAGALKQNKTSFFIPTNNLHFS